MNKDIIPKNDKGIPHGYWERYWWNHQLMYKCVFINGNEIGFEEQYLSNDGKLSAKNYYL